MNNATISARINRHFNNATTEIRHASDSVARSAARGVRQALGLRPLAARVAPVPVENRALRDIPVAPTPAANVPNPNPNPNPNAN